MLNICPKEFDKIEAAWSLFCLLGHQDWGRVAGVLMSGPEWGHAPLLPLCRDAMEGQAGLSVGQVSAGVGRYAAKTFRGVFQLGRWQVGRTGTLMTGKKPGEEGCLAPGNCSEVGQSSAQISRPAHTAWLPWVIFFSSILSNPSVYWFSPLC